MDKTGEPCGASRPCQPVLHTKHSSVSGEVSNHPLSLPVEPSGRVIPRTWLSCEVSSGRQLGTSFCGAVLGGRCWFLLPPANQNISVLLNQDLYILCFYTLARHLFVSTFLCLKNIRIFSPDYCSDVTQFMNVVLTLLPHFKIIWRYLNGESVNSWSGSSAAVKDFFIPLYVASIPILI